MRPRRSSGCFRCSGTERIGGWHKEIEAWMKDWWETLDARAMTKAHPVNPQRVVWEMSPRLPDDAIVTSDSGSCANWYARDYRVKRGQMFVPVRRSRFHGRSRSLRDRRQVRASGPPGRGAGRGRSHANEQHGRAHHHREIYGSLGRQAAGDLRIQQPGPERGHLGAARDERQPTLSTRARTFPTFAIPSSPS